MVNKLLLEDDGKNQKAKTICIMDSQELKMILSKTSLEILKVLSEKAMYPLELSKHIGVHEQLVYYHVRRLAKAGAIAVEKEENKKGAIAKYYRTVSSAFGFEFQDGYKDFGTRRASILSASKTLQGFFREFIDVHGFFEGKVVVGCPAPHGPFKTSARDGHYAAALTLFMGQFLKNPEEFAIKLDTDVKAEKEEKNNLILVGGPGTNLLTQEINEYLPVRFNMQSSENGFLLGGLVSEKSSRVYTSDTIGIIAKIPNPWNQNKRIIVVAGNKAVGTKACVLALTNFYSKTLKSYCDGATFVAVIHGYDLDGDGKVDSVEVSEQYCRSD